MWCDRLPSPAPEMVRTISFAESPFPNNVVFLDDVSVTAVPAPPLSPLGAALVGLFLLARWAYRRRWARMA
jgi:MYXO-CTERM domain-containing protein